MPELGDYCHIHGHSHRTEIQSDYYLICVNGACDDSDVRYQHPKPDKSLFTGLNNGFALPESVCTPAMSLKYDSLRTEAAILCGLGLPVDSDSAPDECFCSAVKLHYL